MSNDIKNSENASEYVSKAITTTITATSRVSVKLYDNFYTLEYSEERTVPQTDDVNLEKERQLLWDKVNKEVDMAMKDTVDYVTKEHEERLARRR